MTDDSADLPEFFTDPQSRREFAVTVILSAGLLSLGAALGIYLMGQQLAPALCGPRTMLMPTGCRETINSVAHDYGVPAAMVGGLLTVGGTLIETHWGSAFQDDETTAEPEVSD